MLFRSCLSTATNGLPGATNNTALQRCLGRWPWAVIPIDMPDAARDSAGVLQANDPNGGIPWLAVSANLAFLDSCLPALNSDVLNLTYTAFACFSTMALPHPWLTVRGSNGEVLTNRAAAVIILPGTMVTREGGYTQARASAAAPGNPVDYLDRISLPIGCSASCTGTYDNAGLNNEFIQLSSSLRYPDNAEDATKRGAVPFNDIVAYITIDELVPYIERRVLAETKNALNTFAATDATPSGTLGYPWAASYSSPTDDGKFISNTGTIVGMFPFFPVSASTTPAGYATAFNWSIANLQNPTRTCVQVGSNRFINIAQNATTDASVLSGSVTNGTAKWRGATSVEFSGTSATVSFSRQFTWYDSSSRCNSNNNPSSNPPTVTVNRTISYAIAQPACSSPSATYTTGSASLTHRINWTCPQLTAPLLEFPITVTDSIPTGYANPVSASYPVYPGNNASVSINNLRYQPLMASWYFDNQWYKQAFYAVGNASAPASTGNCSSATTLTAGANTGVQALVLLSSKSLTNATRPSLPVTDYLELNNSTAATNCVFEAVSRAVASTYNDQLVVVAP